MTGDHGPFTHSLEAWLDTQDDFLDADGVLQRALEQVETKPQRRADSWPDWRSAVMNKTAMYLAAAAAVAVIALVGFGVLGGFGADGVGGPPPSAEPSAEEPSFDLVLVKSLFEADCADSRFDETFCDRVVIDRWKASGTTLVVPTGLRGSDVTTAQSICRVIQEALSEDPYRSRLGIRLITVLNRYGQEADTCWDRF